MIGLHWRLLQISCSAPRLSFRASEARPGIQVFQAILDSGLRRNDGFEDFCKRLIGHVFVTTSCAEYCQILRHRSTAFGRNTPEIVRSLKYFSHQGKKVFGDFNTDIPADDAPPFHAGPRWPAPAQLPRRPLPGDQQSRVLFYLSRRGFRPLPSSEPHKSSNYGVGSVNGSGMRYH